MLKSISSKLRGKLYLLRFRLRNLRKETFVCPICSYRGPFADWAPLTGLRKHARCPNCQAFERHRIQFLVLKEFLGTQDTARLSMLHFAPENFFRKFFSQRFGRYETADLYKDDVDHRVDIQNLPFSDQSYDFVFASHVLEHIADDNRAIAEIRRVLKPGGVAILPVPIVAEHTIEYPEPNPNESYHVRAPGPDYYDRYRRHFSRIKIFNSECLPAKYQLYLYEDRSRWPTPECPQRPAMQGEKHIDAVPICYV